MSDNSATGQAFEIRTLRDIFNLPTFGQMETCLRELTEAMLQARIMNDAAVGALQALGADGLTQAIEWPEVANWTDDGKGEVVSHFKGPADVPELPTVTLKTTVKKKE